MHFVIHAVDRPDALTTRAKFYRDHRIHLDQADRHRVKVVTAGTLKGTSLDLASQQITLGRANDATLVLNDDYASSRHARIFPQDGQWIVEDLGSTNGTYLDRQKVTRPTPVPLGVPIRIGKTVLELRR